MSNVNRGFKGVWIPKEIWLNEELNVMEKLFLVEIDSLDNENGCFASNAHFSEFFGISKGRCSQIIKSLEEKGMIQIEYIREGKEIKKRVVRVVNKLSTLFNKLNNPIKNTKGGYLENDEGSNTLLSNTNNSNTKDNVPFVEIINYLNQKTEKNFRNVESNKKLIRTRWNEGYRVDDFKKVIDNKSLEWLHNEKMNRYLQPSTLFGTKFDNYLNETPVTEKPVLSREEESYAGIDF